MKKNEIFVFVHVLVWESLNPIILTIITIHLIIIVIHDIIIVIHVIIIINVVIDDYKGISIVIYFITISRFIYRSYHFFGKQNETGVKRNGTNEWMNEWIDLLIMDWLIDWLNEYGWMKNVEVWYFHTSFDDFWS